MGVITEIAEPRTLAEVYQDGVPERLKRRGHPPETSIEAYLSDACAILTHRVTVAIAATLPMMEEVSGIGHTFTEIAHVIEERWGRLSHLFGKNQVHVCLETMLLADEVHKLRSDPKHLTTRVCSVTGHRCQLWVWGKDPDPQKRPDKYKVLLCRQDGVWWGAMDGDSKWLGPCESQYAAMGRVLARHKDRLKCEIEVQEDIG